MVEILECPFCGGGIAPDDFRCQRKGCRRRSRSLLDIADFRIPQVAAVDYDEDWALASVLAELYPRASFRDLVDRVWQERVGRGLVSRRDAELRIAQIEAATRKHAGELAETGWLGGIAPKEAGARILDLGCGPGAFLVATAGTTWRAVGVDISMTWLIVSRKRLESAGAAVGLVCACAERLPFRRETFALVTGFDGLEHVSDREATVGEMARVTRDGGVVACTTPNRFSLSAEPHCRIWGVGFLPRSRMAGYVRWRTGQEYRFTYLLSRRDIRRLFARRFGGDCRIDVPELWPPDIARFSVLKRMTAHLYNRLIRLRPLQAALTFVAPFFRVVARKNATGPERG